MDFINSSGDDTNPGFFPLRSGHTKTSKMAAEWDFQERLRGNRDFFDQTDANMTLQYSNTKAHFEVAWVAKSQTNETKNPLVRLAMNIQPAVAPQTSDYISGVCRSRIFRIVQLGLLRSADQGLYDGLMPYFAEPSQDPQTVLDAHPTTKDRAPASEGALPSVDGTDGAASRLRVLETLEAENLRDYEQNPQACFAGSHRNLDKSRDSLERVCARGKNRLAGPVRGLLAFT